MRSIQVTGLPYFMWIGILFCALSFQTVHCSMNHIIGVIGCVRWHSNGEMLASTSKDKTAQITDIKTGKAIYTGVSADGSTHTCYYNFRSVIIDQMTFILSVSFNNGFERTPRCGIRYQPVVRSEFSFKTSDKKAVQFRRVSHCHQKLSKNCVS